MVHHVRTPGGVARYHEPIGSPIVAHSRLKEVLKGHNVKGLGLNAGTPTTPINTKGDVMQAARLIAQGKHVRLNKVDQVGTLLTDLLKLSKEAKRKHETLDLCRVSVPKTNLFCAKNKGIDRINMPQLAGKPRPGSKAAALAKPGEEVDLTKQFEADLRAHGVKVTDTTLPAASFKASQDQLIGDKVAGIEKFMETAPKDSGIFEPIFVTRDHYIIDGHHRWAAMVGLDAKDGVLGNYSMKVRMVDMDIGEALAAAHAFADDWGISSEGTKNSGPTVAKFGGKALTPKAPSVPEAPKPVPAVTYGNFRAQQLEAQVHADSVFAKAPGVYTGLMNDPDQCFSMEKSPALSWAAYQMEGGYETINNYLRNGVSSIHPDFPLTNGESPKQYADDMLKAFDTMGYTTKTPGKLFRVNVGGHAVPYDSLKIGSVFTDKGVISTSARPEDVAGFFGQEEMRGTATEPFIVAENDGSTSYRGAYLMEIHVPAGTRVLGGAPGGIETMLHPGTKFKVVGLTKRKVKPDYGGGGIDLPTAIVEVQP